jgi:mannose-1-phosphate guanylyltransferase
VSIAADVAFHGPVVVCDGAQIAAGCVITGPTIIGAQTRIGAGSAITASVIWQENHLGPDMVVSHSVIGHRNQIAAGVKIHNSTIISDDTVIDGDNSLDRGVRVWPGTTLGKQSISFS